MPSSRTTTERARLLALAGASTLSVELALVGIWDLRRPLAVEPPLLFGLRRLEEEPKREPAAPPAPAVGWRPPPEATEGDALRAPVCGEDVDAPPAKSLALLSSTMIRPTLPLPPPLPRPFCCCCCCCAATRPRCSDVHSVNSFSLSIRSRPTRCTYFPVMLACSRSVCESVLTRSESSSRALSFSFAASLAWIASRSAAWIRSVCFVKASCDFERSVRRAPIAWRCAAFSSNSSSRPVSLSDLFSTWSRSRPWRDSTRPSTVLS